MESYDLRAVAAVHPSSFPSPPTKLSDTDSHIAGAGCRLQPSDLPQYLEHHESTMVTSSSQLSSDHLCHYSPSDLSSSLHSLLSDLPHVHGFGSSYSDPYTASATCADQIAFQPEGNSPEPPTAIADVEEDSGIHLVHRLITCADSIQRGDLPLAAALLREMKLLLKLVNPSYGIGKVACHFIDALCRRLFRPPATGAVLDFDHEILYHHFYEAAPYLKFAHFTANQAILEAFDGQDHVHIVDFNLMHGLQWPPLIQALALRPNGPPALTLTGIGPPGPNGRDSLDEVGLKLGHLARSVNVEFTFRGVAVSRLEDVKPWMLHVDPKEAVAVNSIMQLHRLLGSDDCSIDSVLGWIENLNPKILTLVEQEANHNQAGYLERFIEALHYYSAMFDSLEGCPLQPEKALAETYVKREICNILCCEGPARVERHEPLAKWRVRLGRAGFEQLQLGAKAFKQASMLLTLFSAEGYSVEEKEGCLTLGWHSRPLIAASAWQTRSKDGSS